MAPPLRQGSRIALIAPAGAVRKDTLLRAQERVAALGWIPRPGRHAHNVHGYLAGTDQERSADLLWALTSAEIDGVWCLRGGYGNMRILQEFPWNLLPAKPRPFIGFSDNTALHLALQHQDWVTYHGPHAGQDDLHPDALEHLHHQVTHAHASGPLFSKPQGFTIQSGSSQGRLVGGNLSLVCATLGSAFAVQAEGSILCLEDVGEAPYRVDRLFAQLELSGTLDRISGVILGAFTRCWNSPHEAEVGLMALGERYFGKRGIPVLAGQPFGHIGQARTIPLGRYAQLDATQREVHLL